MAYEGLIVQIPVGAGGLVGTRNQAQILPEDLIVARNLSLEGGVLRKEGGTLKYNATAITGAPAVLGGWDWWPAAGVQRSIVALSDGTLKRDDGAGTYGTTLASGLSLSDTVPMFVEGGKEAAAGARKLFMFSGSNAVQVLANDGATTAALATPPADWSGSTQPSFGLLHEGRLWAGGNLNDPHRLYFSTTTDHEDLTGAGSGSLSIYPGEGEKLVGAISFKGLVIAWKFPQGVYIVDTTPVLVADWKIKRLTAEVGGVSPLGAIIVDGDVIFVDASGNFHLLSTVQEFGDATSRNLSRRFNIYSFIQENFNLGQLHRIRGVYYASKREAHFAVAGAGATVNSRRFVVDLNREDRIRFRFSDREVCESLWLRKASNNVPQLVSGDDAGFVRLMDQATRSHDGGGYTGEFQTAHNDLAQLDPTLAAKRKIGQFLELVVEPLGNWDLSVDILWDGVFTQTINFNMGTAGAALGSFVLGTDRLAGAQVLNRKHAITGSGRRISLIGRNGGDGQDFSVGNFYLHFTVGDERLGQDAA